MKVKIDRPKPENTASMKLAAALAPMKPGTDILIEGTVGRSLVSSCAHHLFGKGNYSTRKDGDGVRVWRLR